MISAFELYQKYTPPQLAHLLLQSHNENLERLWRERRPHYIFPTVDPDVAPYLEAVLRLKGYSISNNDPKGMTVTLGTYHPLVMDNGNPQFYLYVKEAGALSFVRGELGSGSVDTDDFAQYQRVVNVPYLITEELPCPKNRLVGFRQGDPLPENHERF